MSSARRRVALVTGASSGIGRALSERLARHGFDVGLVARRAGLLEDVAEEVARAGGRGLPLPCDVSERSSLQAAAGLCKAELGPVDLLVANAGIGGLRRGAVDAEDVRRVIQVNFLGAVYAVEAVLPDMLARRRGGLACVSSLAGYQGLPSAAAYSASKAAMTTYFEALRVELAESGVRVTVLAPGYVRTAMIGGGERPFLMELDPAADLMVRSILDGQRHRAFPWPLATAVRAGRTLPRGLYDRVARLALRGRTAFTDPPPDVA